MWQVAWAHPRFGSILASASFDGRVLVWKEDRAARSKWTRVHEHAVHEASGTYRSFFISNISSAHPVNAIAWAPHEAGLVLACASSDGKVSLVEADVQTGQWHTRACFAAHQMGVMAVSFVADAGKDGTASLRFATGGCDNLVKLWTLPPRNPDDAAPVTKVEPEQVLTGHQDWVRDVAWAPHDPLLLASASADRTVLLWRPRSPPSPSSRSPSTPATSATRNGSCEWSSSPLSPSPFPDTVWRISWSDSGHLLAASCGDNQVTLWSSPSDAAKQPGQPWECVSTLPQTD